MDIARLRLLIVLGCLLVLALPATGEARPAGGPDPFRGLGTWIDIYDASLWKHPAATAETLAARGIETVYVETSNYRQDTAVMRPRRLGRLLEAAHAAGLRVVAWYLPSFADPADDVERSLAAVRFESEGGESFDAFALDIESTVVKSPERRNTRLLRVVRRLRAAVGAGGMPLGAITPSPRGLELSPKAWPGFPYLELAKQFDVFLPMVYFTYRTSGRSETRSYVAESIAVLRRETQDPRVRIHVIGGIASSASLAEVRGFVDAVCADRLDGASLYDFATTSARHWSALDRLDTCTPR